MLSLHVGVSRWPRRHCAIRAAGSAGTGGAPGASTWV